MNKSFSWKTFFPIQLLIAHIKHNKILTLSWVLILLFVTQTVLKKYGVPYLYITPEYLGEVSFLSYFIVGFSFGGYIIAFNISSYITNGHRFPFIATLSRPFLKYFINNSFFAITLILVYLFSTIKFLLAQNEGSMYDIFIFVLGFLLGCAVNITLSLVYFINTNKDFSKLFGKQNEDEDDESTIKTHLGILHKPVRLENFFNPDKEWTVQTYLSSFSKISRARDTSKYDISKLYQVFNQNHLNAALFEILVFVTIVFLSFASDIQYFTIPAGASLTLMFTMFVMLTSAIHSWFRGWSNLVLIALFLLINFLSQFSFFSPPNQAYGLNYNLEKAEYSYEVMDLFSNPINFQKDYLHTLGILKEWKDKNKNTSLHKPKMVFITASGGGMRSALWSFSVCQYLDSLTKGDFFNKTQLITGSSGGMIGLSYFRELYLQKEQNKINDLQLKKYRDNLSKDILNRLGFAWTVNDLIFKFRSFEIGGKKYKKDRGYAFEEQLNENTENVMNKKLFEYYLPEKQAQIPMLILSPTIVNDGRRLLISPQPISYLTNLKPQSNLRNNYIHESVEFSRLFKNQEANNLKFSSALRMSSTFPYVMPIVHLPSEPEIQIMDAGIRDNFGMQTTLKFLYTYRKWIEMNTSGVIILQIRDLEKNKEIKPGEKNTILKALSAPVGNIYKNLFATQDYTHDQMVQYASEWFEGEIDMVDIVLDQTEDKNLSLSWHLTKKEIGMIHQSIKTNNNINILNFIANKLK